MNPDTAMQGGKGDSLEHGSAESHKNGGNESPLSGFHVRNLLTYFVIINSLLGITFASQNHGFKGTLGFLLAGAIIADCFDGKFASLFAKSTALQKAMGGELDSLADFVAFGIFPGLVLILNYFDSLGSNMTSYLVLLSALFYVMCVFHRLAFFNVTPGGHKYFIGLPSPLGALLVNFAWAFADVKVLTGVYLLAGILMVAPLKIARPRTRGMVLLVVLILLSAGVHAL